MVGSSLRAVVLAFLVAFSLVACSDDDDQEEETVKGTCNGAAVDRECSEYEGSSPFVDEERKWCEEIGYAWTTDAQGRPVVSAHAVRPGERLGVVWGDGAAQVEVLQVQAHDPASPSPP